MDLIDRQAAIDAIVDNPTVRRVEIIKLIEELPSVEPERKKGRWLYDPPMYACDQCNAEMYDMSPYCPMCGADMRGEQDEID